MVPVTETYTEVVLDAPSGIIRTKVHVVDGEAVEVSILNVPAFLYQHDLEIDTQDWGRITYDISFGGHFLRWWTRTQSVFRCRWKMRMRSPNLVWNFGIS